MRLRGLRVIRYISPRYCPILACVPTILTTPRNLRPSPSSRLLNMLSRGEHLFRRGHPNSWPGVGPGRQHGARWNALPYDVGDPWNDLITLTATWPRGGPGRAVPCWSPNPLRPRALAQRSARPAPRGSRWSVKWPYALSWLSYGVLTTNACSNSISSHKSLRPSASSQSLSTRSVMWRQRVRL